MIDTNHSALQPTFLSIPQHPHHTLAALLPLHSYPLHRRRGSTVERQLSRLHVLPVTEVVIHRIVDRKAWEQIAREHVGARVVVTAPEVT